MTRSLRGALAGGLVLATLATPRTASAGGMFLTDRGSRPLGRGFAFVAGADDAGAIWYNPAGISYAGRQLFLDATLTRMDADFTRVDGGGNVLPTVSLEAPPIPIPMIAYTDSFGLDGWTFGLGALAPNLVPFAWPDSVTVEGTREPAPQRYSLIDLKGSAVTQIVLAAAIRPIPELSAGMGVHLVVGRLRARSVLSSCDRFICTQPEAPDFDALVEVDTPILTATASGGLIYDTGPVRIGASFILPYQVGGETTLTVRLPSAAIFDGAHVDGDRADMTLWMPLILRAGVEVRPARGLRVEGTVVYEGWSIQDALGIVPRDVWLRDEVAVGDYQVGAITVPRDMNDVLSFRLGGEYGVGQAQDLVVRAGANYETSAFDDAHLTPLTLDSSKLLLGAGVSYQIADGLWVDASYGHVFMANRVVHDSRVPQSNAVRPPAAGMTPPDSPVYIGNGSYAMEADVFGLGLRWTLGQGPAQTSRPAGRSPGTT